ncbi:MAG: RNA 2'-phosphotransferase [Thermoprotei archaeon]|nr:MAG: RNA 2'-phosphotransferase [Thermoprotei archaeon]
MPDIRRCTVCGAFTEDEVHCGKPTRIFLSGSRREMLSKLMSGLLRHFPQVVGLKLDDEGFVDIDELVEAIRKKWRNRHLYQWVTKEHVIAVAQLDPKGRFEIIGNKIRARYGHSIRVKISYIEDREVKILYHGTAVENVPRILKEGLKPMKRMWVHLTDRFEDAVVVGKRKGRPAVLVIDVELLRRLGHRVYRATDHIYVTDYVPPEAIREVVKV